MADCVQFPLENRLNGRQIFGRFVFKNRIWTEFQFSAHIPKDYRDCNIMFLGYAKSYHSLATIQCKTVKFEAHW